MELQMVFGIQQQINMANWTVSTSTSSVNAGATVSGTKVLTITPNTGYVISAADFKIGGATETSSNVWTGGNVDIGVNTVTFADTGTPGTAGNTVTATVAFDSFSMGTSNKTLYIDIDDDVEPTAVDRYVCIYSVHHLEQDNEGVEKHTVTTTSGTGITQSSPVGTGTATTISHQGTVTEGPAYPGHLILTKVFAANDAFAYYYDSVPTWVLEPVTYAPYYEVIEDSHSYNADGELIGVTFKVYYTPPVPAIDTENSAGYMCELGHDIEWTSILRRKSGGEPGAKKTITAMQTSDVWISPSGETRSIRIFGDIGAEFTLKVNRVGDNNTYDFTSDTFTAGATTSATTTIGSTGFEDFLVEYPSTASNQSYDITVQAATAFTVLAAGVPTSANDYRLYQYIDIIITLGLDDSANGYDEAEFFDGSPNSEITITGRAGNEIEDNIVQKDFSITIQPDMIRSGQGSNVDPRSGTGYPDFTLSGSSSITVDTDGAWDGTSGDLDSTTGILAGDGVSWSDVKQPCFKSEEVTEISVGEIPTTPSVSIPVDHTNLTAGMSLSASNIRENVTIESVSDTLITLSEAIVTDPNIPITFTTNNITVSSVTDGDTLVLSQSTTLADNFTLTFGTSQSDTSVYVRGMAVTDADPNVVISGTLVVESFGNANKTVTMDIEKLITRS